MEIKSIFSLVGEKASIITEKSIELLSNVGVNVSSTKILNLIIILSLIYLTISVINISKKPLKWAIIILLGILGVSTIISMF